MADASEAPIAEDAEPDDEAPAEVWIWSDFIDYCPLEVKWCINWTFLAKQIST